MSETIPGPTITQIAVASGNPDVVFALCNDGSVWRLPVQHGQEDWRKLPPILEEIPPAREA